MRTICYIASLWFILSSCNTGGGGIQPQTVSTSNAPYAGDSSGNASGVAGTAGYTTSPLPGSTAGAGCTATPYSAGGVGTGSTVGSPQQFPGCTGEYFISQGGAGTQIYSTTGTGSVGSMSPNGMSTSYPGSMPYNYQNGMPYSYQNGMGGMPYSNGMVGSYQQPGMPYNTGVMGQPMTGGLGSTTGGGQLLGTESSLCGSATGAAGGVSTTGGSAPCSCTCLLQLGM